MASVISAMEMRRQHGELLNRVHYKGERIVIERRGEPIAAIISIEDYEAILPILENIEDYRDAMQALEEYRAGKGRPLSALVEEMRKRGEI